MGAAATPFVDVAGAFLVAVAAPTPFLMVLMTVLLAGGALVADMAVAGRFLTTVDVLPSLDSLMALTLRAVRVAGRVTGGGAAAPRFALGAVVDVDPLDELTVVDVVALRFVAAARVDRAFSTMLLNRVVAFAIFVGDTGRAMPDFAGDAGRSRGAIRELDEAGDRTCAGFRAMSVVAGPARAFFLGISMLSISFSLSPPEISWL